MSRIVLFIAFVVLFAACSNKDQVPDGILSKREMQAVMWDMVRMGEFLNGFVLYKDSSIDKTAVSENWYSKVYETHKINKEQFDRSYAYYEKHPLLLKEILDSLSRKQVIPKTSTTGTNSDADTVDSKSSSPYIDTRIKSFDSVNKKCILRKRPALD